MAFKEVDVCNRFFHIAKQRCEKCRRPLCWDERGNRDSANGWEAHHINHVASGGPDAPSNMCILCCPCHFKTF